MQFLCYVTFSNADSQISILFRFERPFTPEHGSDRRETLAKRVSDDLQLFIFRRWNFFWKQKIQKNLQVDFCFQETDVLEELWISERRWQVSRKKCIARTAFIFGETSLEKG